MKRKIILLVFTFVLWTLFFVLQKPVFLIAYGGLANALTVIWHGLPLDLSMAGYLTIIPGLVLVISSLPIPKAGRVHTFILKAWFIIASVIVSLSFIANLALYGYWNFPLDSTPIFFITSSPSAALASVEWWQALLGIISIAVCAGIIIYAFHLLWFRSGKNIFSSSTSRIEWFPLLILEALLFLPIRGGVTVSTMNTGKAYFSPDQELNHAAVNPLFSFMESISHQEDFAKQYRFMDDKIAQETYKKLSAPIKTDSVKVNLINGKPDIYIVILESFSDTLTHVKGVTPNLNSFKKQGAYFRNFYANGFRTDRGLVSILLGYPAPGAVSLMKYPRKTSKITSLAGHLKEDGYNLQYYYGGDADFTNMRSFLVNQGFEKITEDIDFPVSERLSKWGVPDHLLFQRVEKDLSSNYRSKKPMLTVIQTSSSHEPFDVPYHKLNDKILNAFSYTDDCIGKFVKYLYNNKKAWNNSVVIFVPDHLGAWPKDIENYASWRFHIPMIWIGGAVRHNVAIETYGSQQDIAATILGQLSIKHTDMPFSKDLLDPSVNHYAYFMMNDGFGIKTDTKEVIYDNKQRHVVVCKGKGAKKYLMYGQALLQVLFDDIASK